VFAVGTQGVRPTIPAGTPPDFTQLIQDCWDESAGDRPSFDEVMTRLDEMVRSGRFGSISSISHHQPTQAKGRH